MILLKEDIETMRSTDSDEDNSAWELGEDSEEWESASDEENEKTESVQGSSESEDNDEADQNNDEADQNNDEVNENMEKGNDGANEDEDEDNDEADDEDEEEGDGDKITQNAGWADAMAKILRTNVSKRKKSIVLAKAKKIKSGDSTRSDEKDTSVTFEVDGEIKDEPVDSKTEIETKIKPEEKGISKRLLNAQGRVKPSILEMERERALAKVATKGVVQLFNVVKQQQNKLKKRIEDAGPSEAKKEKVLKEVKKKDILDVLMAAKSETVPQAKEENIEEWSVLKDNFMMGTKLRDWDKDE